MLARLLGIHEATARSTSHHLLKSLSHFSRIQPHQLHKGSSGGWILKRQLQMISKTLTCFVALLPLPEALGCPRRAPFLMISIIMLKTGSSYLESVILDKNKKAKALQCLYGARGFLAPLLQNAKNLPHVVEKFRT